MSKARFSQVILGGDQLTAARIRGAKKAKVSSDVPTIRLEGITPVAEDWHTKMNFMGVCIITQWWGQKGHVRAEFSARGGSVLMSAWYLYL